MSKSFSAKLDELYSMLEYIDHVARQAQFGELDLGKIQVACEEVLVNVIDHAYKGKSGVIEIECIECDPKGIKIRIVDQGVSFNPLQYKEVDVAAPLEEREIGGLGLLIARHFMDDIDYERKAKNNILTMKKFLEDAPIRAQ